MHTQKLLYIFEHGPYSNASGQEALEAALIGASFDQTVSLLFLFDGVFQLKNQQGAQDSQIKQYTKTFKALADFDISNIYVHDLSLSARGLGLHDLMLSAQSLSAKEIADLITEHHKVFTF